MAPVMPGDVLAGKYRVERVLGEGGMGVVVAARHLQLDQTVALKFLLPEMISNAEVLGRFEREARHAAQLRSEHVARIIDVGTIENGAPYIVMEFLQGADLSGVLAHQGALPIPVAVDFVLQACDAIAEAHSLGIIHRDLKPQNLFVTRRHDGTSIVKVLDFGISKSTASGGDFAATRTQAVMGSPAYMSPEQMRSSKQVDSRTDIWAMGVVLYQLVTGRVPWEAETFTELCFKVAMDPLPPLPPAGLQPGFEDVVRCCLDKDPARRFPDVYALAAALAPFAPPHALPLIASIGRVLGKQPGAYLPMSASGATGPGPGPGSMPGTLQDATGQRATRTMNGAPKRRDVGVIAAVGAVLGVVVLVAVLASRGGDAPRGATPVDHASAAQPAADKPALPPAAQPAAPPPAPPPAAQPATPPVSAPQAAVAPTTPVPPAADPPQVATPASEPAPAAVKPHDKQRPRPSTPKSAKSTPRPNGAPDPLSSPD